MTAPQMICDLASDLAAGFVLGALDPSEESSVRNHLATCAEPHLEFEALGSVVAALVELDDLELVEPPASLGARIMAAAAADLAEHPRVSPVATIPFPNPVQRAEREARRDPRRASRFDWALRIAAVVAIVAVGGWGLNLQRQLDAAARFDGAVAAVVQAGGQPGAKTVVLASAKGATASGIAAVKADGSVVLAMRGLGATSGNQVYEAWVIVGQQAPVAVGGFAVDSNGTASFTTRPGTTPAGAIIALTLEPNEGNTVRQGPVVSAGVASAPPGQSS